MSAVPKDIAGAGGGGKAGGGQARTPVEAPDTLHSVAYARIIDILSEGEIVGLENDLEDVFLDETPLMNADGTLNFKNVQIDTRTGTQDQEPLPGFPDVESETGVGTLLTVAAPFTRSFTNLQLTGIRVRLAVAALSKVDTKTGDTGGHSVSYSLELAVDGGAFGVIYTGQFKGKASQAFERSHAIDLPPATVSGWQLRVKRLSAESTSQAIQDDLSVVSTTDLIHANIRYVNTAIVGLIIDAAQFRSIPKRGYRAKGRIIRVPSNYDPASRTYTGIWDGTFQVAWTNNPAWIYFDLATHPRYGLGHLLADTQVDKWALYQIAQYCDELVDDGKGGTEPRFTCTVYLQKQGDAYKVLQDLAAVFRGMAFWAGGLVVPVCDRPADPVYTYTNANVINGRFVYGGTGRKARHTVALVQWSDPSDFGRGKVEYVADEEGIARYGVQILTMTALGCQSQGMAHRAGKWALLTERLETDTVQFSVGLDGSVASPGQTVRIADSKRAGRRTGGRVKTSTTSVMTPDRLPTVAVTDNLTCILPSGLSQTRPVSAVGATTITVSPAFDVAPLTDSVWTVESTTLAAQLFRIIGVVEGDGITYNIIALEKNASKFGAVDFGYQIQTPNTSVLPSKLVGKPETLTLSSFERVLDNLPQQVLVAQWAEVATASAYEISYRRNDGDWSSSYRVLTPRHELESAPPGSWVARVVAISSAGLSSLQKISDPFVVNSSAFNEVVDVVQVGATLEIDCSLSERFRVTPTANITTVTFINVSREKTFVLEVVLTGNYDITWPTAVAYASGLVYNTTGSGTVAAPKSDLVGLRTESAGVQWQMRVSYDVNSGAGIGTGSGPTAPGVFSASAAPNPAFVHAAANPSLGVTVSVLNGVGPFTYAWTRGLGGKGDWAGSTGDIGGTNFTCSNVAIANPVFSRTGGASGYVAQNWICTVKDSSVPQLSVQLVLEIALEDDGTVGTGGHQCVSVDAWIRGGGRARDVSVGDRVVVVGPSSGGYTSARVSYSARAWSDCYVVTTESGVVLTCSVTAPIPVRDGRLVNPAFLEGLETRVEVYGELRWEKVSSVKFAGLLEVQHITCEDKCFLAGDSEGRFILHHNIKHTPADIEPV